ncbi:MAG: hypothetical protein AAF351_11990 [Pseudomonadota bacterium]
MTLSGRSRLSFVVGGRIWKRKVYQFEITYLTWPSGFTSGRSYLNTLALIFDKVYLPTPFFLDHEETPQLWSFDELVNELPYKVSAEDRALGRINRLEAAVRRANVEYDFKTWREQVRPLFDLNVIDYIPTSIRSASDLPLGFEAAVKNDIVDNGMSRLRITGCTISDLYEGRFAEAIALRFGKTNGAKVPRSPKHALGESFQTESLAGLLGNSLFQLVVPQINHAHPEEVLMLREELKDDRAGFLDTLVSLVNLLESRLGADGSLPAGVEANEVLKRELLKQSNTIEERVKKVGKQKRMGFMKIPIELSKIDVPITAPKFWGELAGVLFGFDERRAADSMDGFYSFVHKVKSSVVSR